MTGAGKTTAGYKIDQELTREVQADVTEKCLFVKKLNRTRPRQGGPCVALKTFSSAGSRQMMNSLWSAFQKYMWQCSPDIGMPGTDKKVEGEKWTAG